MKIFFEIRKQKYLEALDRNDRPKAVEILVKDLKVFYTFNEDLFKEITQLLTLDSFRMNEQLSKYADTKSTRSIMLVELKKLMEANPLFREKLVFPAFKASWLRTLINQSNVMYRLFVGILQPKLPLIKGPHKSLLHHLTVVLGNDELAACFMLLHLLLKVHSRVNSIAVGKLSFNLTTFDKSSIYVFGNRIDAEVKNLLPFSYICSKVEERMVVLSVLRMIKENYHPGEFMRDDMFLILGVHEVGTAVDKNEFDVKDAITKLL